MANAYTTNQIVYSYDYPDEYQTQQEAIKREKEVDKTLHMFNVLEACKKFDDAGCQFVENDYSRTYRRNNILYQFRFEDDMVYLYHLNGKPVYHKREWFDFDNDKLCDDCYYETVDEDNHKRVSINSINYYNYLPKALGEKQYN